MASRIELIGIAIQKWRQYGDFYRTAPTRYRELIDEKRKLKMKLNCISKKLIQDDYPKNYLLSINDEDDALKYLEELTEPNLSSLISDLVYITEFNYVFVSMRTFIIEGEFLVRNHNKKSRLGLDPDQRTSRVTRHRSRSTVLEG